MLYNKCRKMLDVEVSISKDIFELDIIRRSLSLIDSQCLQLSLLEVERLWDKYSEWHGCEIIVDKDSVKKFIRWISDLSYKELVNAYKGVDNIYNIEKLNM